MDIAVGDTILTRKQHPCGAASFEVLRVGMDFKIRCTGCGREVMLPGRRSRRTSKRSSNRARNSPAEQHIQKLFCKENCLICRI